MKIVVVNNKKDDYEDIDIEFNDMDIGAIELKIIADKLIAKSDAEKAIFELADFGLSELEFEDLILAYDEGLIVDGWDLVAYICKVKNEIDEFNHVKALKKLEIEYSLDFVDIYKKQYITDYSKEDDGESWFGTNDKEEV